MKLGRHQQQTALYFNSYVTLAKFLALSVLALLPIFFSLSRGGLERVSKRVWDRAECLGPHSLLHFAKDKEDNWVTGTKD